MKKILLCVFTLFLFLGAKAQVTVIAGDNKVIDIGDNGFGDYTHSLILLHEIYNGVPIEHNYAIGMITALRGSSVAGDRINVANVNTASSYVGIYGTIVSYSSDYTWQLKTCVYNGKKYLAADVPYGDAYHNWGFKFSGSTSSTGESMKCVSYLVRGQPVNQNIVSDIQNFNSNMVETHAVYAMNISGNVGIGVNSTNGYKLGVNGNVHAQEVTVDMNDWPDYVFKPTYDLASLKEIKTYIEKNNHLPGMPSESEVVRDGVKLGELNKLLLKKIEELTLHLIEKEEQVSEQQIKINNQENRLRKIESLLNVK